MVRYCVRGVKTHRKHDTDHDVCQRLSASNTSAIQTRRRGTKFHCFTPKERPSAVKLAPINHNQSFATSSTCPSSEIHVQNLYRTVSCVYVRRDWNDCLTCDPRQTRGPIRDAGEGGADVSQDAVHVIFHPNWHASIGRGQPTRKWRWEAKRSVMSSFSCVTQFVFIVQKRNFVPSYSQIITIEWLWYGSHCLNGVKLKSYTLFTPTDSRVSSVLWSASYMLHFI